MEKALLAYALLYPHYVIPGDITLPYKLGDRVSIVSVPNFGPAPGVVDELRGQVATEIREFGIHHCIAVECSIERPRANRQALEEEQKADLKQQVIRAYLSLWLARPTLLAFRNLVFTEMQETDFLTLAIDQGNEPYVMPKDLGNEYIHEDLVLAGKIFEALTSSPAHKAVHMAALITTKAIWETALEFRFLLFLLALESSFGTEDHRVEITFRLAQRMAFFLEADRIKAKETADLVRRCYNVRSKIVHGYRIAKVSDEEFLSFTEESETLLRRALLSILKSEATMKKFNGGEREEYLDNLTFSNG